MTLAWDPPIDAAAMAITGYLVLVAEPVNGFSSEMSVTTTSVTVDLDTAGIYHAHVVAINCIGASQENTSLIFELTGINNAILEL